MFDIGIILFILKFSIIILQKTKFHFLHENSLANSLKIDLFLLN